MSSEDTQFKPRNTYGRPFKPGHPYRWQPGQSGNPRGVTKTQAQFRELYVQALAGASDEELTARAQELANLAWAAARKGEPWAYQEIRGQLAPLIAAAQIRVTHEVTDDGLDFRQLSDHEFQELGRLLEKAAGGGAGLLESGAVPTEFERVSADGVADD